MRNRPLRAFLFVLSNGEVELSVHRDIQTISDTWSRELTGEASVSGLLHVGFDRPATDAVQEALANWPGRLLVSESTRWCLPPEFRSAEQPIASIAGPEGHAALHLYLGIYGWGYEVENPPPAAPQSYCAEPRAAEEVVGWLAALRDTEQTLYSAMIAAGIADDYQYARRRRDLPTEIRDEIDDFRYKHLQAGVDTDDLYQLLRIAPDWLLSLPVAQLPHVSLRVHSALGREGVTHVYQILDIGTDALLQVDNFGRRSLTALTASVREAIAGRVYRGLVYNRSVPEPAGHFSIETPGDLADRRGSHEPSSESEGVHPTSHEVVYTSLRAGVLAWLSNMAPRDRVVVEERLGWSDPPRTLEEIGEALGVSRERARQLESRGLGGLMGSPWTAELVRRIDRLMEGRTEPLYLDLLAAEDGWFDGFDSNLAFLARLIERCAVQAYVAWPLDGRLIVSRTSESDWSSLPRTTESALEKQIAARMSPGDVRLFIEAVASTAGCPELTEHLFARLESSLHFARDSAADGRVLASVGRSAKAIVSVVFQESVAPMSLNEVRARYDEMTGEIIGDVPLRQALRDVGAFPFGGRRYGLERHLGLSSDVVSDVVSELETILVESSGPKQWHCAELRMELLDRRPDLPEDLDPYALNVILHRSARVSYLGRFVWVSNDQQRSSTKDRFDIADLCVYALTEAGGPLSTSEIKAAIGRIRGLNSNLQVFPSERIARMEPTLWGLIDRDFKMNPGQRGVVLNLLHQSLARRGNALHVSEIHESLRGEEFRLPAGVTEWMVYGLAQIDERFWIGRGQLIGLAAWSSLNRFTVRGAIHEAVRQSGNLLWRANFYEQVNELAERTVERFMIDAELKLLGYELDEPGGYWRAAREVGAEEEPMD